MLQWSNNRNNSKVEFAKLGDVVVAQVSFIGNGFAISYNLPGMKSKQVFHLNNFEAKAIVEKALSDWIRKTGIQSVALI